MAITYHTHLVQGDDEWLAARCGILTASEMKLIVTPTLKPAKNDKERSHLYELTAQRITKYVEPHYVSDDMVRGMEDEITARNLYSKYYASTTDCGFVTNDIWGFTLGYSPDALVGDNGLIECKSRRQKYQVETIIANAIPVDYMVQVQTGLLVTGRKWLDFVSYSAGLPMFVKRVYPDPVYQKAIVEAAAEFHARMVENMALYNAHSEGLMPTERTVEKEMHV